MQKAVRSTVIWIIALIVAVVAGLWAVREITREAYCSVPLLGMTCKKNPGHDPVSFDEKQLRCLHATMEVDSRGESPEKRPLVQKLIADTVLRLREQSRPVSQKTGVKGQPTLEFCDIWTGGLTIYPDDWDRGLGFKVVGRSLILTEYSPKASGWEEIKKRAKEVIDEGFDPDSCATLYVRPEPGHSYGTNEESAQVWIRKNLKRDLNKSQGLKTEFYCRK